MAVSNNMRGALLMMGSMACFTMGDTCIKAIGGAIPLGQMLFLRGIFASLAILALAQWFGQLRFDLPRRDWALIALRAASEVGAAFFFLTALMNMPIANVTALLQMLPLTVTLAGALFFREPVGWRRWSAIIVGFGGMLLIVRPGTDGFTLWSVYALIAVLCVTVRDLATRRMSPAAPSLTVTLVSSLAVMICAGLWSIPQDWAPLDARTGPLLAGATGLVIVAYSLSVLVMRVGEISFVAPFRYTGLVWALVLGLVVFGEWPSAMTLIGAAVIAATGLFTFWRETRIVSDQAPKTART